MPYADRAEINAKGIATRRVLFYADDPVALFFLQIQGSGRVVFDDGSIARIAYAGENGQPYTAIGRTLIADGALTREEVSLQTIRAWLMAHPDRAPARDGDRPQLYLLRRKRRWAIPALGSTGIAGRQPHAAGQPGGGSAHPCPGRAFLCRGRWARSGARR